MSDFVSLFEELGDTTSTLDKVERMRLYFASAPTADIGWAIYVLSGGKLERAVSSTLLREWASEYSEVPLWLVEESYHVVGDLAETTALLVARGQEDAPVSLREWIEVVKELKKKVPEERKHELFRIWAMLSPKACLVFNKLVTGGLRIGVARGLVIKAISKVTGCDEALVAQRLMGITDPGSITLERFRSEGTEAEETLTPYPFYLAFPLENALDALGKPGDWLAEWKWDGIRSQSVARYGRLAIWSRGEELVTDSFPELLPLENLLPRGTVIDGEIVAWRDGKPASFSALQQRLNRKRITPKVVQELPVSLVAYDVLEYGGKDLRSQPLVERRAVLETLINSLAGRGVSVQMSGSLPFRSWEELLAARAASREHMAEGLMLKRLDSSYGVGRRRGDWWKWKVDPLTCDGVLMYAQKGHGRRADLFTDYTFGVWRGDELVPFAKAYSGLTDRELREVDAFVKAHTREKFGPVRTVTPELVFEIAFEGIQLSSRHKSGIAVRFPRILRWRRDKPACEADELATLIELAGAAQKG